MIPKQQSVGGIRFTAETERSPTIPVQEAFTFGFGGNKKQPGGRVAIPRVRSPQAAAFGAPAPLRRTKSLPNSMTVRSRRSSNSNNNNNKEGKSKSLFWFRPHTPDLADPCSSEFDKKSSNTSTNQHQSAANRQRHHRRHATNPDVMVPQKLGLPTLVEEDGGIAAEASPLMLKKLDLLREESTAYSDDEDGDEETENNKDEDNIVSYILNDTNYSEELELDLRGLSLLEERDEQTE